EINSAQSRRKPGCRLADSAPSAVGTTTGCAARRLRLAADVDRVGIGPAELLALRIGLAWHDLAAMLGLGIVPGRVGAGLAIFEGLIFRGRRPGAGVLRHAQ